MVDAVGSGTTYTCNVTGEIPSEFEELSSGKYLHFMLYKNGVKLYQSDVI